MSIWKFREIRRTIGAEYLFTLEEGETRLDEISTNLFIKREDLNPTGSWKDRGSAYKITQFKKAGVKEAVISTSGNAAISFLEYAKHIPDFKLTIIVSPKANPSKVQKIKDLIKDSNHELIVDENPRKKSVEIAAAKKIHNLRASIDEGIVKGYWSLGFELEKVVMNSKTALILPVSSGTALVGMVQGLFMRLENEHLMPSIFVCQTQSVHPIVDHKSEGEGEVRNLATKNESSLADAIIDLTALRAPQVIKAIKETNGDAFAITNDELEDAKKFASNKNLELSYTSLLSIAGYLRLLSKDIKFDKYICIASGS